MWNFFVFNSKTMNRLLNYSSKVLAVSIASFLLTACGRDNDLQHHIEGYGQIVSKDNCTSNGKQGWLFNLNLSKTTTPNGNEVIPVQSDTLNGVKYNALVRVFINIKESSDTTIFKNEFRIDFNPTNEDCPSSLLDLSDYTGENYWFVK